MRTVKLLFTTSFQASVSTPLKSGSMPYTGSERRPKIDADQLFSDFCREHRDRVWLERGKIKKSTTYPDAYITEDYTRAIQEERKKLIKARMKARDAHGLNNDFFTLTRTDTIMRIFLVSRNNSIFWLQLICFSYANPMPFFFNKSN